MADCCPVTGFALQPDSSFLYAADKKCHIFVH